MIKKNKTIAVAESCTGGLLSRLLTAHSGSSQYFILGVVSYSNTAKNTVLGINREIIAREGAVSKRVALCMAQSVKRIAGTDFGIGITGIAGPTGGSKEKPVGTVFIAVSAQGRSICRKYAFRGSRSRIQQDAASAALRALRELLP